MDLSTKQRTVIIVVFALYTAALLLYSLVTRKAMQKGKGDYLSKFYTGGRSGGIIITAMMVSAGVVHGRSGLYLYIWGNLDGLLLFLHRIQSDGAWTSGETRRYRSQKDKFPDIYRTVYEPL